MEQTSSNYNIKQMNRYPDDQEKRVGKRSLSTPNIHHPLNPTIQSVSNSALSYENKPPRTMSVSCVIQKQPEKKQPVQTISSFNLVVKIENETGSDSPASLREIRRRMKLHVHDMGKESVQTYFKNYAKNKIKTYSTEITEEIDCPVLQFSELTRFLKVIVGKKRLLIEDAAILKYISNGSRGSIPLREAKKNSGLLFQKGNELLEHIYTSLEMQCSSVSENIFKSFLFFIDRTIKDIIYTEKNIPLEHWKQTFVENFCKEILRNENDNSTDSFQQNLVLMVDFICKHKIPEGPNFGDLKDLQGLFLKIEKLCLKFCNELVTPFETKKPINDTLTYPTKSLDKVLSEIASCLKDFHEVIKEILLKKENRIHFLKPTIELKKNEIKELTISSKEQIDKLKNLLFGKQGNDLSLKNGREFLSNCSKHFTSVNEHMKSITKIFNELNQLETSLEKLIPEKKEIATMIQEIDCSLQNLLFEKKPSNQIVELTKLLHEAQKQETLTEVKKQLEHVKTFISKINLPESPKENKELEDSYYKIRQTLTTIEKKHKLPTEQQSTLDSITNEIKQDFTKLENHLFGFIYQEYNGALKNWESKISKIRPLIQSPNPPKKASANLTKKVEVDLSKETNVLEESVSKERTSWIALHTEMKTLLDCMQIVSTILALRDTENANLSKINKEMYPLFTQYYTKLDPILKQQLSISRTKSGESKQ